MAGIGQRFTSADHSAHWNTQSQCAMGRPVVPECGKPVTTFGGNFNKRTLFGSGTSSNTGAPTFSDVANLCSSGYNSRPSSSQQNGEIIASLSGGAYSLRSPYSVNADPTTDGSMFGPVCYNGIQSGSNRNISEPSIFPSLPTASRTVGTDLSGVRITMGTSNTSKPLSNAAVFSNTRAPGSLFSSTESGSNSSSSRGITLDPSEFPPILTTVGRSGNSSTTLHSTSNQPPLRNYVSVMSKGSSGSDVNVSQLSQQYSTGGAAQPNPPEFSKQDFPALPGANQLVSNCTSSSSSSASTISNSVPTVYRPMPSMSSSVGQTLGSHRSFNQTPGSILNSSGTTQPSFSTNVGQTNSCGLQLLPNHLVANIPKNMICDQFGMLGLLKLIRVGDYDTTLNMLAPGLDLSLLHNNWQTTGELYNTFVSPFHDSCIGRPQDMDYPVPPEYLIRHLIAGRLPDPPVDQLSEETLFWLFYNCCREEIQLVVAKELYQREWRFHKKEQIWLTRIMGANFTTDNNSEQGDYYFWDPLKAQKSSHQMTILYSDLDNAPASFRLSSSTLSAFVSVGVPASGTGHYHHSGSHSNLQQLNLYHQQPQYPHNQQQASLSQPIVSGTNTGQLHSQSSIIAAPSPSAATLASLFNTRQQHKNQQSNSSTNYLQTSGLHARGNSVTQRLIPTTTSNNLTTGVLVSSANMGTSVSNNIVARLDSTDDNVASDASLTTPDVPSHTLGGNGTS